jgi:hypothetical protein
MNEVERKDLLILVSDKNMEAAVSELLSRHRSFGIRSLDFDIRRHPQKDSGCCLAGVDFLHPFCSHYRHALLMFDLEGSSRENECPASIEIDLEKRLDQFGWEGNAAVLVLAPELEIWVWTDSPHVEEVLDWTNQGGTLREWLCGQNLLEAGEIKPLRPKDAMEQALWTVRKPRSSSIYQELAEKVSLMTCQDRAFCKLKSTLTYWFSTA